MKVLNQKSGVCEVANVAKVGVVSALIGAGLFFSACGSSDEFKPSNDNEKKAVALVKEKYPDYKILSYETIEKRYKIKNGAIQKCVNDENQIVLFGTDTKVFRAFTITADIKKSPIEGSFLGKYSSCLF